MNRFLIILFISLIFSCQYEKKEIQLTEVSLSQKKTESKWPRHLSEWKLFEEPIKKLIPTENVIPYNINSSLFTDYAHKARFIKLPHDEVIEYHRTETFKFPIGTTLIKNFYYPEDFNQPEGKRRILETRLLVKGKNEWEAIPYVWNEEQTNATLEVAGATLDVNWKDEAGVNVELAYSVPNQVQCKSCHERNGKFSPIGPSARQLNRDMQLQNWATQGLLTGLPEDNIPSLVDYANEEAPLRLRARAWLEVNCAHCHSETGPAKNTGLYLTSHEEDNYRLGIGKPPVAAGKGSGGHKFGIVPGSPEKSILYYRILSQDPGVMMPELGRKMVHQEGVELIKEWIDSM